MKKIKQGLIINLFVLSIFLLGNSQLVFANEQEQINLNLLDKKESLKEITMNLKDYLDSTREKIESSSLIPESEKPVVIETLKEKSAKITDKYIHEIESITTFDEVKKIKSRLKDDIKEVKKVVEKPVIKIQKSKISKVISNLKIISMKLSLVMPALGESEKEKIKELKSLIDSANKKLERAEKLSNKRQSTINSDEIKYLLNEATKEIKLAFGIVRDLLSQMESDLLSEITGSQDVEEDGKKQEKYDNRPEPPKNHIINPTIWPTRKTNTEKLIQNIYVDLDEIFSLEKGQSAKLISKIRDADNSTNDESVIITLKQITNEGAGTDVDYLYENSYISNKYDFLKENEGILIDRYELKMISLGRNEAKYIIKYKDISYEDEYGKKINIVLASGDTVYGVKLLAVDVNGNSCTIEYNGIIYTINEGYSVEMDNGRKIKVEEVMPVNRENNLNYCEIEIDGD